jgi:hypothetical protein
MDTQFQTPTTTTKNDTKESNEAQKNTLKEEMLKVITENFMELLLDMVNQKVQEALKNSKTLGIKNIRRHRNKQMN